MNMNKKIILTDVDGVLLDWSYAFETYLEFQVHKNIETESKSSHQFDFTNNELMSHVRTFNKSVSMGFLPALRDSIQYVKILHEKYGYQFHAISSMGINKHSMKLRTKNLKRLFGDTVFDRFVYLDLMNSKEKILSEYKNSEYYWIEDDVQNARDGLNLGLKSILIEQPHNINCKDVPIVKNWNILSKMIINS